MHSSYNLIKNNNASIIGGKEIVTNYTSESEEISSDLNFAASFEKIGNQILEKARSDAEKITMEAIRKAGELERDSYTKGYEQGLANGYEDGLNKGYEEAKTKGEAEVTQLINKAKEILSNAEHTYNEYLLTKKQEIIELSLNMAKVISKKEFQLDESIINLVEPIIEECKGEENLIIKCNEKYVEILNQKAPLWKKLYSISGEILILEDPLMDSGNAVIEKNKGKISVGMDISLSRLEESLREMYGEKKND